MPGKRPRVSPFAVADIAIGAVTMLFLALASSLFPFAKPLPFFSQAFLTSLALPAFILLSGTAGLLRAVYAGPLAVFISFLGVVNSLAALFSPTPPVFLEEAAPPGWSAVFHFIIPSAALAYFGTHALLSLIALRKTKPEEPPPAMEPLVPPPEIFCASCQTRLLPADEACPSCGALIRGLRCAACDYEGRASEFADAHCPRCGEKIEAEEE